MGEMGLAFNPNRCDTGVPTAHPYGNYEVKWVLINFCVLLLITFILHLNNGFSFSP